MGGQTGLSSLGELRLLGLHCETCAELQPASIVFGPQRNPVLFELIQFPDALLQILQSLLGLLGGLLGVLAYLQNCVDYLQNIVPDSIVDLR